MKRIAVGVLLSVAACGAPSQSSTSSNHPPIEATYRARCGSCHMRVGPGTHTREALEAELVKHRNRLHLSETQWSEMVDFLAAPSASSPAPSAPSGSAVE